MSEGNPPGTFDLANGVGSRVPIQPGIPMPVLGLGVWQTSPGRATREAVLAALHAGYRLIDTAALYGNERDVGEAIRTSGIDRNEVFVTTKLWNDDQGHDSALRAFERSRSALGVDTVDLYLLHWPVRGLREESWRALGRLQAEGKARAIGVSNFTIPQLEGLARSSPIVPSVNQVEFSPFLYQSELLEYCRARGIQLEAYSPLSRGRKLDHPLLGEIGRSHGKSPAQVVLRWNLQHAVIPIPKSARPERILENSRIFDFALTATEMTALDHLHEGLRVSWDPSKFD